MAACEAVGESLWEAAHAVLEARRHGWPSPGGRIHGRPTPNAGQSDPKREKEEEMIARFRVLLPYLIWVRQGDTFVPEEFDRDGYRFKVYAPYQAPASTSVLVDPMVTASDAVYALQPSDPPVMDTSVVLGGQPTVRANVVQIEVSKPEFDRRRAIAANLGADDPPINMLFEVLNSMLYRLRCLTRSPFIQPISREGSNWRIEYLTDAGEPVAQEEGKVKARSSVGFSCQVSGITAEHWQGVIGLPRDFHTKAWEELLLDAEGHLPDVVPAIVLSAVALEVLIGNSLAALAPGDHPAAELWHYINNRGDHHKEPSVKDEYDVLLRTLTGRSLKEEPVLWQAFCNLRDARNALVHRGTLAMGGRPITRHQAYELVGRAKEITLWIEALLPGSARRPAEIPCQLEVQRPVLVNRTASPMAVTRMEMAHTMPATHCVIPTDAGGEGPASQPDND
jgi:hypothetical protein